ncbi:MAG: hypothetical protein R3263_08985, partial [Myxococcota bacterium]|nr:hypothetical protein [Myxococcota bacterium]
RRVPLAVPAVPAVPVRVVLAAVALLVALLPGAARAAGPVVTDAPSFSTAGQSLWGPTTGQNVSSFVWDVLDEDYTGSVGEIQRVTVAVDNSDAQAAWETAIDTCDKKSYCFAGLVCFSPTRNQCRDGYCYPVDIWGNKKCVAGIGPKPAGTVDATFDVGAEIAYDLHFRTGVRGSLTVGHGTVDVDADAVVQVSADTNAARPGDLVTLQTAASVGPVDMRTQWPGVDGSVELYVDSGAWVEARAAGPDTTTGSQRDERHTILDSGTLGVQSIEMAGFHVGADGLELRWMGNPFVQMTDGIGLGVSVPVVEVPGALALSLPILDLGLYTPEMATPVADPASFLGDAGRSFDGVTATNWVRPAQRLGFSMGFFDSGTQDTDVGRFDADADVVSAYAGAPMGMAAELVPVGPYSLFSVEGNAFDIDLAFFFGFRKQVDFEPNLEVELRFDPPVEVQAADGSFALQGSVRVPAGSAVTVRQPQGGLTVQPVYSVANNRFRNDTDFVMEPAIEEQVLSLSLGGLIYDFGGAPAGLPQSFGLAQVSVPLSGSPVKLADMNYMPGSCTGPSCASEFALGGFQDVTGTAFTVYSRLPGTRCGLGFEGALAVAALAAVRRRLRGPRRAQAGAVARRQSASAP